MPHILPQSVEDFLRRRPEATLYRAPGRINLIGEHTDYNEGWVLPAAAAQQLYFAVEPSEVPEWRIRAGRFSETTLLPVEDPLIRLDHWSRYAAAVLHTARAHDLPVPGMDIAFDGDLPAGAGMSSSSALTCGLLLALNDLADWGKTPLELANLARESEHRTGVRGGIMDQFTILHAEQGAALLLDCRSLEHRPVRLPEGDRQWMLFDSGVAHELVGSEYNDRRAACERVVAQARAAGMDAFALRDMDLDRLRDIAGLLDPNDLEKAAYVIEENGRVHAMVRALEQGDWNVAAQLLASGHHGLREKYRVSCRELDFIVDHLNGTRGEGAGRLMGGGFGGGVIALLRKESAERIAQDLSRQYREAFGLELRVLSLDFGPGAARIS